MKLRRVLSEQGPVLQIDTPNGWVAVPEVLKRIDWGLKPAQQALMGVDAAALLGADPELRRYIYEIACKLPPDLPAPTAPLLPFEPRSYRDFMLYEQHVINSARGFVREFMPGALPFVRAYEAISRRPFPALRPRPLFYRQPIYYMGNHLAFRPSGSDVEIPSYTRALDYELELGFVLSRPLRDATPEQAEAAIGGFVVFNDISARDVQRDEMDSGLGPQKAKHFCNLMSEVVVSADEILPRWQQLKATVELNKDVIAEPSGLAPVHTLGAALAHVSKAEQLYPGEFFATGTWPGGCGLESGRLLKSGDKLKLSIEAIGEVSCRIV